MAGLTATSGNLNDLSYLSASAPTLNPYNNSGLVVDGQPYSSTGLIDASTGNPISLDFTGGTGTTSLNNTTTDQQAAQEAAQRSLLQQGLDAGIAQLQGQLGTLDSQQQLQVKNINDQYGTSAGRLGQQYKTGQDRLKVATDNVNESKTRSLANLGDWLRGMGQGYQNQLGTMGAGNSSATGLINFALGKQGGRERGNILQDAGTQLYNLDTQGQDLKVSYENNMFDLEKWKNDNINQIGLSYTEARNQINNSIQDLRQKAYAEMDLMQQAVGALQALENNYTTQASTLKQQYDNLLNNQNIDGSLMNFQYSPVAQANLNGLGMPTAVNPESGVEAFLRRRDESAFSNPLGA